MGKTEERCGRSVRQGLRGRDRRVPPAHQPSAQGNAGPETADIVGAGWFRFRRSPHGLRKPRVNLGSIPSLCRSYGDDGITETLLAKSHSNVFATEVPNRKVVAIRIGTTRFPH